MKYLRKRHSTVDLSKSCLENNNKIFLPDINTKYSHFNTHSWFSIKETNNNCELSNSNIEIPYENYYSRKYYFLPTKDQIDILNKWFKSTTYAYNQALKIIKGKRYYKKNCNENLSFITIRNEMKTFKENALKTVKIPVHIFDLSIKKCVENYKGLLTNFKRKNIKKFRIRYYKYNFVNRKTIYLEPSNILKNGYISDLGEINMTDIETHQKYELKKENIKHNFEIKYSAIDKKYYIVIVHDRKANNYKIINKNITNDKVKQNINTINDKVKQDIHNINNKAKQNIDIINQKIKDSIDKINQKAEQDIDKTNDKIKIDKINQKTENSINKINNKAKEDINKINQKTKDSIDKINNVANEKINKINNKIFGNNNKIFSNKMREDFISIDPGINPFLTGVSKDNCIFIGENMYVELNKHLINIDKCENSEIKPHKKRKYIKKVRKKTKNKVDDMHWKSINYLTSKYNKILIGDLSVKRIVELGEITKKSKRIMHNLRLYEFKQKLENRCKEEGIKYEMINEFMTSKTCSVCGNIKTNLKKEKVYNCEKCKTVIQRDINGARCIYNVSLL